MKKYSVTFVHAIYEGIIIRIWQVFLFIFIFNTEIIYD